MPGRESPAARRLPVPSTACHRPFPPAVVASWALHAQRIAAAGPGAAELALALQRQPGRDPEVLTWKDALWLATAGGAAALGIQVGGRGKRGAESVFRPVPGRQAGGRVAGLGEWEDVQAGRRTNARRGEWEGRLAGRGGGRQ